MKKLPLILLFLLILCVSAHAETLTLSTYYPAPFGSYDRLRLVPRNAAPLCDASQEGVLYYADDPTNALNICQDDGTWGFLSGVWMQDALDNIYPSETTTNPNLAVGIGTTNPQATLHIAGDGTLQLEDSSLEIQFIDTSNDDFKIHSSPNDCFHIESDVGSTGIFTPRMTIQSNGNVGIGVTNPNRPLLVRKLSSPGLHSAAFLNADGVGVAIGSSTNGNDFGSIAAFDEDLAGNSRWKNLILNPSAGNVGIGTTNPDSLLHLYGTQPSMNIQGSLGGDYESIIRLTGEAVDFWYGGYIKLDASNIAAGIPGGPSGGRLVIGMHPTGDKLIANDVPVFVMDRATGNIGIQRMPDNGATDYELAVNGTIYADGADLAENILVEDNVEPGDVVVISEKDAMKLRRSDKPYDPKIAGVISTDPGLCIGEHKEGYQPLALTGQVPTKVTTENGPIQKGDMLTSSSKPGYAMKASFIPVKNIESLPELTAALEENRNRQLAIVGKALEDLAEGEGTIVILMAR